MAENRAVKDIFSPKLIEDLGRGLASLSSDFPLALFTRSATKNLDRLEFKERMQRIADVLADHLPRSFPEAARLLRGAVENAETTAVAFWPMCQFVQDHGLGHYEEAMLTLENLTKRISAEWAVRPYLDQDPVRAMTWLERWARHSDPAVRRLVSEGTRPRLPWTTRLEVFGKDPNIMLPLLEQLRDDSDEVVRRSVANHINDIAKEHPDWVARTLTDWNRNASRNRQRLIRHALRTLIKQGHRGALDVLGIGTPHVTLKALRVAPATVKLGSHIEITLVLVSTVDRDQELIIDYALHHRRANGKLARKVFKWSQRTLNDGETLKLTRRLGFQQMSTRHYYPGEHLIELLVNGETLGKTNFELQVP